MTNGKKTTSTKKETGDNKVREPDVQPAPRKPNRLWPELDPLREYDGVFDASEFTKLAVDVPLLMLPVRLETKLDLTKGEEMLRIRIYPDQIQVKPKDEGLTEEEQLAGRLFWSQMDGTPREAQLAALTQLAQQVGGRRLGYVIDGTGPDNASRSSGLRKSTVAPSPELAVLPDRWIAIGYSLDSFGFLASSGPIIQPLATGLARPGEGSAGMGVPLAKEAAWLIDYEAARDVGMAIDVPLPASIVAAGEITSLVVFGVNGAMTTEQAQEEVRELFLAHERSIGLGFLPQGTPTNNTQGQVTEWSYTQSDLSALLDRISLDASKTPPGAVADMQRLLGLGDIPALLRAPHATDNGRALGKAMKTVLFEAAAGRFARQMLPRQGAEPDPMALEEFRQWFIDNVHGGAPVATLRVGPQPYGFLPVTPLPRSVWQLGTAKSTRGFVENTVVRLREEWLNALDTVPLLDPNAIDRPAAHSREASDIPAFLASQPHPARLFFRPVFLGQDSLVSDFEATKASLASSNPQFHATVTAFDPRFYAARDIDEQLSILAALWWRIENATGVTANWKARSRRDLERLLGLLGRIEQRQRPLKSLELPLFAGVVGDRMSAYLEARPDKAMTEFLDVPLVSDEIGEKGPVITENLRRLAEAVADGKDKGDEVKPADLLTDLISAGLRGSEFANADEVALALTALSEVADTQTLDLLARETLGLTTHRLDAWYSSLAMAEIEAMRVASRKPTGLTIGAFGWLTDLKFAETRPSNGFVHAPSLPQAATAAVLRSGWLAHGGQTATGPGAINANSARIRLAHWILDGMRAGQALGTLLGYRFERALREDPRGTGDYIHDIRRAVIAATGGDATEDEPVDGERLLTLTRAGDPTLSALAEREALKPHFLALLEIFDAVHDCAVLEGTHAATQGQSAHASAVFEAVNQGTRLPPEFSANRIPKSGTSVSHRVALVLPKAQWPLKPKAGWGSGLRDKIWPEVELWLRDLLPSAAEIGLTFAGKPMALADLQMSAIDAVFLMGDDPTTLSPAMRMLIAGSLKADPDTGGEGVEGKPGSVPLEEVQIIAAELRGLLSAASEMTSATFGPAGSSPTLPTADPQVEQRIVLALTDLETAIQQRDPIALARFGIASGDVKQRFERAERMLASAQDASGRAQGERTQALFGKGMPPCRSFAMPKGGGIAFHERLKDHDAWGWLDKVAAVRPVLRHLGTARMLSGMLTPLGLSARIGQDRLDVNEAWCAVSGPPQGTGGRLSLVAIGGKAMPEPGDPVTGFMLDQWSERIAAQDQLTGVALHYDAPSSKPPQAMLLAAAPNGAKHWRMRDVAQTLFDTLQFAALRMVQPEDLTDFGGVLPTTTAELSDSLLEQEMGK